MVPDVDLPVQDAIADVLAALRASGAAVLEAPPGAGKTTLVPLALADASWLAPGRIVVLEPRRVAARAAARRMSQLVGDELGGRVGFTTRDGRAVSGRTRVEVVTEGILVNRLQRDPALEGTVAVVFDEFHERSLDADLGLALCLEIREALRDDLRLLVMSATLEGERVARLLGDAPVMRSAGRQHPVEIQHRERPDARRPEQDIADAVVDAVAEHPGDVLVFLPGVREIRRTADRLDGRLPADVVVTPLHGRLPPAQQDRAIDPLPRGLRKVILSTDIAQTSLTIEGVRVVVDAGSARVPAFDPRTGMSRLDTVRVSRADADQRAGRAGRLGPGVAIRLWPQRDHAGLDAHPAPEIAQADLASFALEVTRWGARPGELRLLDAPPAAAWDSAIELLHDLEIVDDESRITGHGRDVARLPVHPRLGHLLVRGAEQGAGATACVVAALLSERDPLRVDRDASEVDLALRVRVVDGARPPAHAHLSRAALQRIRREAARLGRLLGVDSSPVDPDATGWLLALAYPDRVAQRRPDQRGNYVLATGRGGWLPENDVLAAEDLLVAADVTGGGRDARIHLAAGIDEAALRRVAGDRIETSEVVAWDDERGDVVAEHREHLGAVVLARRPLHQATDQHLAALLEGVRRRGLELLPWTDEARELQARVAFLRATIGPSWPDLSDEALLATLDDWLGPFLLGARRAADLARVPLSDALRARLAPPQLAELDELAPTHVTVPSGKRHRIRYDPEQGPTLAIKLQELFGARTTPRVAGVPVTLELLSPARRPVQVTRDLASFWSNGYPEVRAQLRGRYPKHPWPEDPLTAIPTARTKRRTS